MSETLWFIIDSIQLIGGFCLIGWGLATFLARLNTPHLDTVDNQKKGGEPPDISV